jgi:hypothetical protein
VARGWITVSVDLYMWYEAVPVTADEALAKLDRWDRDEPGVFVACPARDLPTTFRPAT